MLAGLSPELPEFSFEQRGLGRNVVSCGRGKGIMGLQLSAEVIVLLRGKERVMVPCSVVLEKKNDKLKCAEQGVQWDG